MKKTFTVYAENLTQPVKIAFTLSPRTCLSIPTLMHHPIAFKVMKFNAGDSQAQTFEWHLEIGFSLCTQQPLNPIIQLMPDSAYCKVPPAHYVELTRPPGLLSPRWSQTRPSNQEIIRSENMVAVYNRTLEARLIALGSIRQPYTRGITDPYGFRPIACYHVASSYTLYTPASLMLQAYVVDPKTEDYHLLEPSDLKKSILDEPLECDELGAVSKWKLSQDPGGRNHLERPSSDDGEALDRIAMLEKDLGKTKVIASSALTRVEVAEKMIEQLKQARAWTGRLQGLFQSGANSPPRHPPLNRLHQPSEYPIAASGSVALLASASMPSLT